MSPSRTMHPYSTTAPTMRPMAMSVERDLRLISISSLPLLSSILSALCHDRYNRWQLSVFTGRSIGVLTMATFVSTIKFTDQGIQAIKHTTKRAASVKAAAKKMGVKVTNVYWTLGAFDGLLIFEAPDDEAAMALMLHLGSMGNLQTTTARAFSATEMDGILSTMTV